MNVNHIKCNWPGPKKFKKIVVVIHNVVQKNRGAQALRALDPSHKDRREH